MSKYTLNIEITKTVIIFAPTLFPILYNFGTEDRKKKDEKKNT